MRGHARRPLNPKPQTLNPKPQDRDMRGDRFLEEEAEAGGDDVEMTVDISLARLEGVGVEGLGGEVEG